MFWHSRMYTMRYPADHVPYLHSVLSLLKVNEIYYIQIFSKPPMFPPQMTDSPLPLIRLSSLSDTTRRNRGIFFWACTRIRISRYRVASYVSDEHPLDTGKKAVRGTSGVVDAFDIRQAVLNLCSAGGDKREGNREGKVTKYARTWIFLSTSGVRRYLPQCDQDHAGCTPTIPFPGRHKAEVAGLEVARLLL
ncbi:hypothetical protein SODALDRAFT_378572 [Sodiomyces alkalinus F11]|uniref:Uncharacterized protein n=1 Tax=Sodiomyces alkalinus (strain CBS 110278 / VKM F-3762 / F11) TaxID=1314773 RepID=A0A3N2PVK3_SODAK|nr:hypothetical protein SODALDRAFT_378572 [Sodiomyces alkalinus F11]ROT38376.1 hypothetical protein SODALDRAFT_378572 [Sodiomyces alkalinus F11]